MKINYRIPVFALLLTIFIVVNCKKETKNQQNNWVPGMGCNKYVAAHPGWEVWAGDTMLLDLEAKYNFGEGLVGYNIQNFGYKLIDSGTTTKSVSTGSYKYYLVVAKYFACVDAIQFFDSSYYNYGPGITLIGGLAEHPPGKDPLLTASRFLGPPDGIGGCLGYTDGCPPPVKYGIKTSFPDPYCSSFNGFMTDDKTITSRGGGLKIIITSGCDCVGLK